MVIRAYTPVLLFVTVFTLGYVASTPINKLKDDRSPRITIDEHIHEKLTKLKQLLNDLEKEESLEAETDVQETDSADNSLTTDKSKPTHGPDVQAEDKGVMNEEELKETKAIQKDRTNTASFYRRNKDLAMRKFLDSLSPESLHDLEVLRKMMDNAEVNDKKDSESKDGDSGYIEHSLTETEEKEANWREVARKLEHQRDQLYLEKQLQNKDKDGPKMKTHTIEGTFGKFTDEVKESVEKNLLSDVALAIHSGISVDDIIEDIMGKNKAAM